jgi:methionine-rich copper-binding protein CopC
MAVTGIDVFETIRINPPAEQGCFSLANRGREGANRSMACHALLEYPAATICHRQQRGHLLKWPFSACRAGSTGLTPASGLLQISFLQSTPGVTTRAVADALASCLFGWRHAASFMPFDPTGVVMLHFFRSSMLIVAASLLTTTSAWAHAHLQTASPAANSVVSTPASLSLSFSEALDVKFSGVKLSNAEKQDITLGDAALSNGGKTLVVKPAQPLPAGSYQLEWHVLSVDGHKTKGSYHFSVGK